MLHVLPGSMNGIVPSVNAVPPGSVAAMVRALASASQPAAAFRDAACAALRLTRERGRVECEALAALFEDAETTDDRRMLILDLLALAGTPEAQAAMRRLLAGAVARRGARTFASFVQRLGFMERPDAATLRFLIGVYAESKGESQDVRAACAYALGASAGRAHVWGLTDAAMRASEVLRHDLLCATSASEKCALVTALGNAAVETDVSLILRFASDAEPRVRSAAVLALKKMHTAEARASLLMLLTTSDESVAESALSTLFEQTLGHDEIVRLAELVLAGRTPLTLDSRILRLVVTQKLHVVGQVSLDTVEDAIALLLSRIEAQAVRGGAASMRSYAEPPRSRYVRPFATPAESTAAPGASRSRMMPTPKTPLPYSAGYSMVSLSDSNGLAPVDEVEVARPIIPEVIAPVGAVHTDAIPPPPADPGALRRTLSYGALSDALRVAAAARVENLDTAVDSLDCGWDDHPDAASGDARYAPSIQVAQVPTTTQKLESEIRTLSAVSVPCPIVPLAIIR